MSKQPFFNSEEPILPSIYFIRGEKVILDRDLAILYGVETKRLKEAVKRNIQRFPLDFMFELTDEEFANWRSQFASSNSDRMGLRYNPMAFTEQGCLYELEDAVVDRFSAHDDKFELIFDAINQLTESKNEPRRPIGFNEPTPQYKRAKSK